MNPSNPPEPANPPSTPAADQPIRVLILEDQQADAELELRELRKAGLNFTALRVETQKDFRKQLHQFHPDLILADYTLPSYDGLSALALALKEQPGVPFILVSGTLGEETAIDALHSGAADYILKQRLQRLGPAARRALNHAAEHRKLVSMQVQLRKMSRAVSQAPVSIVITDREGLIEFVNPKFTAMTGYTPEDVIGKNPSILKSGEIPAEEYRQLWKTITEGRVWCGQFHNRRKDGTLFWEAAIISPILDEAGSITHFIAAKEDITEKKQLEICLLRAQRLEAVGMLAGGIAHDLNNILSPMFLITPFLRDPDLDTANRTAMVDTIESCARRGADIVKQLLVFSRGGTGDRIPLPVGHLFRDIDNLIRETFPRNIRLVLKLPRNLPPILGDPTQIQQALLNLCVNARDAMPQGGDLTLQAVPVHIDVNTPGMPPDARPGPYVCINVSDTGAGIPPGNLDLIFDPFFTTKEVGKGTGLGLAMVLGIMRGHGGFILVSSKPGKGTTFQIYFPASPHTGLQEGHDPAPPAADVPNGHGEWILVVDDEPAVREGLRRILETHGYVVLVAKHGAEGIACFSQHRNQVRAVVSDVMMPVMTGPSMFRALREIDPALPIVLITGLTEKDSLKDLAEDQRLAILIKPFTADNLLQNLHGVMTQASMPP